MWQDYGMMMSAAIFAVAVYRQVIYGWRRKEQKIALFTAVSTAALLAWYACVYCTLGLWYASATSCVTLSGWLVVVGQVIYYTRRRRVN